MQWVLMPSLAKTAKQHFYPAVELHASRVEIADPVAKSDTPICGFVEAAVGGRALGIHFLHRIAGVGRDEVERTAVSIEAGGTNVRVMHPLLCLEGPSTWWWLPSFFGIPSISNEQLGGEKHSQKFDENLLQHVSPLGWEHINLTGDYVWRQNKRAVKGNFRALRPLSAFQPCFTFRIL
jgi:hypothetical protein